MKYIIATHGKLAEGYLETLKMFTTEENIYALCAYSMNGDNVDIELENITAQIETQEELIIFTDLFGGSVTQKVVAYFENWNVKIYAGVNLPFVLEVILRGDDLRDTDIEEILSNAKNQIVDVKACLKTEER